jgi:3-hydroxyacyl-CoA dehydrogenase
MAVDLALKWGFMHEAGPFETWDALGVAETVEKMEAAGHKPAPWVREMLAAGCPSFYQIEADQPVAVYDLKQKGYRRILPDPGILALAPRKKGGAVIEENAGASIVDLGDGIACVEFHTKMNALDTDIWELMSRALDRLDAGEWEGLVIGNEADNFCAGANIFLVAVGAQNKEWAQLEKAIRGFQAINQRIRYSTRPVGVAVAAWPWAAGARSLWPARMSWLRPRVTSAWWKSGWA